MVKVLVTTDSWMLSVACQTCQPSILHNFIIFWLHLESNRFVPWIIFCRNYFRVSSFFWWDNIEFLIELNVWRSYQLELLIKLTKNIKIGVCLQSDVWMPVETVSTVWCVQQITHFSIMTSAWTVKTVSQDSWSVAVLIQSNFKLSINHSTWAECILIWKYSTHLIWYLIQHPASTTHSNEARKILHDHHHFAAPDYHSKLQYHKNIAFSYLKLTFTALLCIYNMVIAIYQLYSHQLLIDAQKKSFSKHFRLKDMHPTNIFLLKWIFKGRILKSIFLLLLGINCYKMRNSHLTSHLKET